MNGLALRISKGGVKKSKTSDGFPALQIASHLRPDLVSQNLVASQFIEATNTQQQLNVLKEILTDSEESYAESTVEFLSTVFFHAETKHPVKSFLARHIKKSKTLAPQFSKSLSTEISSQLLKHSTYDLYIDAVTKTAACLESFQPGVQAVRVVDVPLAVWLMECLQCCVDTLSNSPNLSSTEKNEIFTLCHTSIRILLYITRPDQRDDTQLLNLFGGITESLKQLLLNDDVPMDTKTVCGILILNMRYLECPERAWKDILQVKENIDPGHKDLVTLLSSDACKLALYSAVATSVTIDSMGQHLTRLIHYILGILERNSSESSFVLGATRSLVQISKNLDKMNHSDIGIPVLIRLLDFIWGYLDHHMDSVRHLTAQLMFNVVRYCVYMRKLGEEDGLRMVLKSVALLDKHRKSYYTAVTALAHELGAQEVMAAFPGLLHHLIAVFGVQALQASATTTLEVLLQNSKASNAETIYRDWIEPVLSYVRSQPLDSSVLNILEAILVKAVKLDPNVMDYILPTIKSPNTGNNCDLKCTLMLLSVARKCNALGGGCEFVDDSKWKDVIGYEVLQMAAVDAVDETRILSLSLIVESPKSTEPFTRGELSFVLHYLTYNLNAQSPSFRQLTLSLIKKFLKRLEDSYKVLHRDKRQFELDAIFDFMSNLRALCFDSLIPGANYSRRFVVLTVLLWCDNMHLDGYQRTRTEEEVEKLLYHLEDSYENNKALALAILNKYPKDLFMGKTYSTPLDLKSVLKQASSLKPTDCVAAAYKFDLMRSKLPEYVLLEEVLDIPDPVTYSLLRRLLNELTGHVAACKCSIVAGAAYTPMYPLIHCIGHTITAIDPQLISSSLQWSSLIEALICTGYSASEAAAPVVNNSSPEGHLPSDLGTANDLGNSHGVTLEDGRQVTAQMVLLCAWRTVKEVSLLLGDLSSLLTIQGEGQDVGTLTTQQVSEMGGFFTRLLAETKHRGAFEQAYVGFMKLLTRLWRCRSIDLHSLPRQWLDELMEAISSTDRHPTLCSTRRSAGLPFMIQALVTTELQVQGNPKCFHQCMTTLLRLARTPDQNNLPSKSGNSNSKEDPSDCPSSYKDEDKTNEKKINSDVKKDSNQFAENSVNEDLKIEHNEQTEKNQNNEKKYSKLEHAAQTKEKISNASDLPPSLESDNVETRTHAINILRALFRNASLDESVASYVGEGLMVALQGFEGRTWMERNSSTLLFSALMVRVFGVQRSKDGDNLCIRNRMTGRIFFLRYPHLYDFMLRKLVEVSSRSECEQMLQPSLYPILLLLARLYPSSLEGTDSNLKLVAFVPHVISCAGSAVMKTRQLAAKAIVPLIPPQRYVNHLESMFEVIGNSGINRNTCHGILLQLIKLLEAKPDNMSIAASHLNRLAELVQNTQWILRQATQQIPCYLVADEYVKVVNLLIWRFPSTIKDDYTYDIIKHLGDLLFNTLEPLNTCGREVCLSNCLYLYFILLNKKKAFKQTWELVYKSLRHRDYEVVLTALNYLLVLYKKSEMENKFQEHLNEICDRCMLKEFRQNYDYLESLCFVLNQQNLYAECRQKALKIFTLEETWGKCVYKINLKNSNINDLPDEFIIQFHLTEIREHENLTYIYLESLSNFVTNKFEESNMDGEQILEVVRVVFECSSSNNADETREVVVKFFEANYDRLLKLDFKGFNEKDKFEYQATIYATVVTMLEDDDSCFRQRMADTITKYSTNKVNTAYKCCIEESYSNGIQNLSQGQRSEINAEPSTNRRVISSKAAEIVRGSVDDVKLLMVLALMDFKSEVYVTDDAGDECRVFDTNEKYNVNLEETIWARACAQIIKQKTTENTMDSILNVLKIHQCRPTFEKLCGTNLIAFEDFAQGGETNCDFVNPKIKIFLDSLRE